MDLELPTGFETAQHAYQSVAHTILGQDVAGDGLFVELTELVLEQPVMIRRRRTPVTQALVRFKGLQRRVCASAKADC